MRGFSKFTTNETFNLSSFHLAQPVNEVKEENMDPEYFSAEIHIFRNFDRQR